MSNSASISAAKKRRGGAPPPMPGGGPPMNLPPGLPPNFRQLPPHIQQQLFMQMQQKANAAAAAAAAAPKQAPPPSMPPIPTPILNQQQPNMQGGSINTVNVPGPYTVNSVIHNRAVAEVDGVHIRDLPISAAGLPCLPSGAALPPNVLFKLHHDELLNMDAILNEHSNKIQMLMNKVDRGVGGSDFKSPQQSSQQSSEESSYDNLVNNNDFITKILDNILTNTNLSDIINQIEPLQKENESLRGLLHSQQVTLNELSGLVMKLLSNGLPPYMNNAESSHENMNDTHEHEDRCEGEHEHEHEGKNETSNENAHEYPKLEYSVYIPEDNGHGNEDSTDPNGEQVDGYEETDGGANWDS